MKKVALRFFWSIFNMTLTGHLDFVIQGRLKVIL